MKEAITQRRLKEVLHYDPEMGVWTWKVRSNHFIVPGQVAGVARKPDGYRIISVDGMKIRSSHLAFLYMVGFLPLDEVDHIDCNPRNDAWVNLRLADSSQNKFNKRVSKVSSSGLKGAYWHSQQKRWRSQIQCRGKITHLGMFDTPEEAHAAYTKAATEIFGEFARF